MAKRKKLKREDIDARRRKVVAEITSPRLRALTAVVVAQERADRLLREAVAAQREADKLSRALTEFYRPRAGN